ncbi:MAG: RDD family protein [Thermoplasmata archaeon]|nr:MAG: RDD family protein [Thermoplasmata archaeon]
MPSALDQISDNNELQSHWIRRFIACIIDAVIVYVGFLIIGLIIFMSTFGLLGGFRLISGFFFFGIVWVAYGTLMDVMIGGTFGKRMMSFRVKSTEGKLDFIKALIRNVSKIHVILLFLDWLGGFVTSGDPRQKFLDRVGNTTVEKTDVQESFSGSRGPSGPSSRKHKVETARR